MSLFRTNLIAVNVGKTSRQTPPLDVIVHLGSELSWLPAGSLSAIGVTPVRTRSFQTATKQSIQRPVGYAILRSEGYETVDEVVGARARVAESGDMNLLGVRTLEGFGVVVDAIAHKFVATTTIVA